MSNTILQSAEDGICTIVLNRPAQLNAVDGDMMSGLHAALTDALKASDVRVIIITGAGEKSFSVGNDKSNFEADDVAAVEADKLSEHIDQLQDISRLIMFGDKPVIAAVNGYAVGAGFEWALNCDFNIWSENATAFMPELKLGLYPTGGASVLLPRMIGMSQARSLMFLGEKVTAQDLLESGFVQMVVPANELMEKVREVGQSLAQLPRSVTRTMKAHLIEGLKPELERAFDAERDALVVAIMRSIQKSEKLGAH